MTLPMTAAASGVHLPDGFFVFHQPAVSGSTPTPDHSPDKVFHHA